jgi:hypothetical protein
MKFLRNYFGLLFLFVLIPVIGMCEVKELIAKIQSIKLPTNIEVLEKEFGKASNIILPEEDDASPWGQ